MGKKNRKNNLVKRRQRGAKAVLSRLKAVAARLQSAVTDDKNKANTRVYNASTCKPYGTDITVQTHLTSTRFKWAIYVGFMARDNFSKEYLKGEWIVSKQPYYFDELSEVVADEIEAIYESVNKNHVLDAGWIAVPYGLELEDETVFTIFKHYGGFSHLAQWEVAV